ncbi:hypothetical protein ACUXVY_19035 [Chromobacterium haemolyticum]|uniref:hypothetical protein n=1 Tax=Chromobacterium haemolyticum TaxID=394935 RepID=UPI004055DA51
MKYIILLSALILAFSSQISNAGKGWFLTIINNQETPITINRGGQSCWYWKDIPETTTLKPLQSIRFYTEASDNLGCSIDTSIAGINITTGTPFINDQKNFHIELKGANGNFGPSIVTKEKCGSEFYGIDKKQNEEKNIKINCSPNTQNYIDVMIDSSSVTPPISDFNYIYWHKKYLDYSRNNSLICNIQSFPKLLNAWECEDKRSGLSMDYKSLDHTYEVTSTTRLYEGRYIYVYRAHDNKFLIRRYDRIDGKYAACDNYYKKFQATSQPGKHVRHTQLNGITDTSGQLNGWGPVWSAGELKVNSNERIIEINNNSGHFKPLFIHVEQAVSYLKSIGKSAPDIKAGGYEDVPISLNEADCIRLSQIKLKKASPTSPFGKR